MAASLHLSCALFLIVAVASPALSLTCTSQKLTTKYADCSDLPTLNATVHWTYNASSKPKPTLTVGFTAPPAKPDGWVAWALNPKGSGMVGAQSLIAFKDSTGSVVVKTYSISGYGPISESKISYDVLNKSAEFSDGVLKIFATVALPEPTTELNQVWQAGSAVNNGVPMKHNMSAANLGSKGTLKLGGGAAEKGSGSAPAAAPASHSGGSSRGLECGLWLHGALVLLGVTFFGF